MHKPILLFAFASDIQNQALPQLRLECDNLRDCLKPAEQAGLCELEFLPNATVEQLVQTIQALGDRLTLIHIAGHNIDTRLFFESLEGTAGVSGQTLAQYLGHAAPALQLVFLNGCATHVHTRGLLSAGIDAVLATLYPVYDHRASQFAQYFYQALGDGRTIETAFEQARSAMSLTNTSSTHEPTRGVSSVNSLGEEFTGSDEPGNWGRDWHLKTRQGSEAALRWNLAAAAEQPLWGLPTLPESAYSSLPAAPYPGLKTFTEDDAAIFFGRGAIIRRLFEGLTDPQATPLVVLSGQSGVGKSSVLAAGVLPRIRSTHTVCYLRCESTDDACGWLATRLSNGACTLLSEAMAKLQSENTDQPMLVILDQFESLWSGGQGERVIETLLPWLRNESKEDLQSLRWIWVIRQEYGQEIDATLGDRRLAYRPEYVRRLRRSEVIEAIRGVVDEPHLQSRYRLTITDNDESGALEQRIADDLLDDEDSPIGPSLQILLHNLWQAAKQQNTAQPTLDRSLYHAVRQLNTWAWISFSPISWRNYALKNLKP